MNVIIFSYELLTNVMKTNHATIAIQSIMYFIAQQRRIKSANAKYIMQTPDGLTLH